MLARPSVAPNADCVGTSPQPQSQTVATALTISVSPIPPDDWESFLQKYTNNIYTVDDKVRCSPYLGKMLSRLFVSKSVGKEGLQYLVAWTFYRQLFQVTDPIWFLRGRSASEACYEHVEKVLKLAITSHYFQSAKRGTLTVGVAALRTQWIGGVRACCMCSKQLQVCSLVEFYY
ncbi:hypothetical protein MRX96_036610 [Rhipicephalus microplus]